jgi:hypothetical protein
MGEIVLYVDANFGGLHTHVFESTSDLSQLKLMGTGTGLNDNVSWNDIVSSFVVVSGVWALFKDPHFKSSPQRDFGPGRYSFVEDFELDNDSLSSLSLLFD